MRLGGTTNEGCMERNKKTIKCDRLERRVENMCVFFFNELEPKPIGKSCLSKVIVLEDCFKGVKLARGGTGSESSYSWSHRSNPTGVQQVAAAELCQRLSLPSDKVRRNRQK